MASRKEASWARTEKALMNEGVRFRANGVFTKRVLRQFVSKAQKQFHEAER